MWNEAAKCAATRQVMQPPPHSTKVVAPNTALLSSVFKQYTFLNRLTEVEACLRYFYQKPVCNGLCADGL